MWSLFQSASPYRSVFGVAVIAVCGVVGAVAMVPYESQAQGNFSMTVTPPLFQLSVAPGNEWKSSLTIVNSNPYPISVYAYPVDFRPTGEEGKGSFLTPLTKLATSSTTPDTLAGWIDITRDPISIARDQTATIPFTVKVPELVSPGGHYAAILVTNQPGDIEKGTINVGSAIASLVFLSVAGNIDEAGIIRDFYPDRVLNTTPEVSFTLRFENRGNVHLRPVGNIVITNMWGRPRGTIEIGGNTEFGNVLPGTVRKFNFAWRGDDTELDIGRYKAITTLSFGTEGRQNITRTISFWVVPVVPLLKVLGGVSVMLFFMVWGIRRYIRHAVEIAARSGGAANAPATFGLRDEQPVSSIPARVTLSTLVAPLTPRALDLRDPMLPLSEVDDGDSPNFVERYWFLAAFTAVAAVSVFWINTYFEDAFTYERDYEITVLKDDGEISTVASTTEPLPDEE